MKHNNQYKLFKVQNKLIQVIQGFTIFQYLIPFLHLVCLVFLLILNIRPQLQGSLDIMYDILSSIKKNYLTHHTANSFILFGNILYATINISAFIRFKLTSSYDEISKHQKLQKFIFTYMLLAGYMTQITLYSTGWCFSEIYHHQGLTFAMLKCLIPIFAYIYFTLKCQTVSLYGWLSTPIALLITLPTNSLSYLIAIAISLYLLIAKKSQIKKVCLGICTIMLIFTMKNSKVLFDIDQSPPSQIQISFLCIGIFVLLTPIVIIKMKQKLNFHNSDEKAQISFDILSQLKGNIPYSQIKFEEYYDLYNNVSNLLMQNKQVKQVQIKKIMQKNPSLVTKNQYLILLQKYLDRQCKKSSTNHTLKLILLIKIRMTLNYPINIIIDDIFSVNQQLEKSSGKYRYEFYQIFDLAIKKYAMFKQTDLQTASTFYLNQLHEKFQINVFEFVDKIFLFWKSIAAKKIPISNIHDKFGQILALKKDIDEKYELLTKFSSFQKEKQIMSILKTIVNPYQVQKVDTFAVKPLKQDAEQQTLSFLILQNNIVKFVSKDLLKSLGQNNSLIYENVELKQFFGEDISVITTDLLKNVSKQTQTKWQITPVLCRQGFVQLKKIKILWYPSLETKNRNMIKFSDDPQLINSSFLIYDWKSDTIKYFNEKFIDHFSIDKQKLLYQINNYQIFFNQLFVNVQVPIEEIKSYLKEQSSIRCKIYLKKFVQNGTLQSVPVQIKVFKCISVNNQIIYCILKLVKLKQKKSPIVSSNTQNLSAGKNLARPKASKLSSYQQDRLALQYKDQQFFCKIPNHYETKITQKESQLQEPGRFAYHYLIHALFGLIMITIITFWSLDSNFLTTRISSYRKGILSIQNVSQQYALIYQAYSVAMKRYYIQKYPLQCLIMRKVPGFVFDSIYGTVEQKFLDQFMIRYLQQINDQPNKAIDYSIDFKYFSINTSTQLSTLIDFAQNIKRHIQYSDIDFLLKNYNNFRDLTIRYENSYSLKDSISQIYQNYEMYIWILLATTSAVMIIITLMLCKIEAAIQMVYDLMERMQVQQLKEQLINFNNKKQQIINAFNQSIIGLHPKEKHRKQLSSLSSNSSGNDHVSLSVDQNKSNEKDQIISNDQSQCLNANSSNANLTLTQKLSHQLNPSQDFQTNQKLSEIKSTKKIIDQPFLIKIFRKSFFILLLFGFYVIFFNDANYLAYQRDGIIQLFDMKRQFYIALLHVKRQQVDAQMIPTLKQYFNKSIVDNYTKSSIDLIASIPNKIILQELQDFGTQAFNTFSTDLCRLAGVAASMGYKPCINYLNGSVAKGFKQAFQPYLNNAKLVAKISLSQAGLYPCTVEKCPPYYEHQYASVLMGQVARYIVRLLNASTEKAFQKLLQRSKLLAYLKIVGLLVVVAIYLVYRHYLKKRCRVAIQFFGMIPNNIMCSMKMTSFLRKNKILNKLDIL